MIIFSNECMHCNYIYIYTQDIDFAPMLVNHAMFHHFTNL